MEKARTRLIKASNGIDVDIDDLMKWYSNDYEKINAMKKVSELRVFVLDYQNERKANEIAKKVMDLEGLEYQSKKR